MVDLINQIDFKREIFDTQAQLPQNIQAIKLYTTHELIIIEPNSKSLQIDTRLIIDRNNGKLFSEILDDKYKLETPQLYSAFIGLIYIKSIPYLILVDKCTHHSLHPLYRDFFQIVSTSFYPLDIKMNYDNQQNVQNLRDLLSKGFYFTYENCDDIDRAKFMWNFNICKSLQQQNIQNWDVLVIQGFIDSFQVYLDGKKIHVAIIAKRSVKSPGTRLAQTGINENGNVANYVETEQIVSVANIKCSFKQIRGSVPIFWREKGSLMKNLELYNSDKQNQEALEKHFNNLIQLFQRVVIINLMNKNKQTEHELIQSYELGIQQLNSDRVKYVYYNFDEQTQGVDFHIINQHVKQLSQLISNLQFDSVDLITKQKYLKQKGIVRTNCLACLDRTNVYQQRVGLLHLDLQLKCMGIDLQSLFGQSVMDINEKDPQKSVNPLIVLFRQLWADHGDQISYLYSGTGSMHTNQEKQGSQSFFAILGSGMVPLNRFYRNNFSEHIRQESIQTLLGKDEYIVKPKENDQCFLNFTNLEYSELIKLGYNHLFYKGYKQNLDGTKYIIYGVTKEKNIQIQCYGNRFDKYQEEYEQLKQIEKSVPSQIKIKRIDQKFVQICELGLINLNQLMGLKYESSPFTEQQLLSLLYELAQQMKQYQNANYYLNGINTKSIWFSGKSVLFDVTTHIPSELQYYPTIIKPDYIDPYILLKIQQQEQAFEKQEDLSNPNDLMNQNTGFTKQEIEQCQVWILARIIYVTLFYPQPQQTNSLEIMLPYLNSLIENQKFILLSKLLKRMLRLDLLTSIISLDVLIQEMDKIAPQQQLQLQLIDNPIIDEKYSIKEYKTQIELCKHFRNYEQGLKSIDNLKLLSQDLSLEEEIYLQMDIIFFYVYLNKFDEAQTAMDTFLELIEQGTDTEIANQKNTIIEGNLLILRCYQDYDIPDYPQIKELLDDEPPENFIHPIRSNLYFIWSQIINDEDKCLQYAYKALEYYKINKIQNEFCKSQIQCQIIKLLIKKNMIPKAQEFLTFQLSQIRNDCLERLNLLMMQGKIEGLLYNKQQASQIFEQCLKICNKLFRDDKHKKIRDIKQLLQQLE